MTRAHNGHQEATPFSGWLRALLHPLDSSHVSNQNLDYVWHDYKRNYLLTIEEKRFGAMAARAQSDTHGVVEQMLRAADGLPVKTLRGIRSARYYGHFCIRFENTTPDDGRMWINGHLDSREGLLALLAFDDAAIAARSAA